LITYSSGNAHFYGSFLDSTFAKLLKDVPNNCWISLFDGLGMLPALSAKDISGTQAIDLRLLQLDRAGA
jgi:hypothetical protein